MRNKGFGPGEGFPEGIMYYAWDFRNAKVEMSAVDYIRFILDWVEDMLEDIRIFPEDLESEFPPNLERDVIKPAFERILHVYAILFHYQTRNPVERIERYALESTFGHFIYASLYWGLLDFNGESATYLKEQIDIPKKSFLETVECR
mmetsp:Transcript_14671/g.16633  ORF Transcript_14671/g.16633 Transcript_14671/m.16633 type:complete len:147 (+) Transcript_14671:1426-1866(+)